MSILFNRIAPIYGLFFKYQRKHYQDILEKIKGEVDLKEYRNIIDLGCGTGALCSVFADLGMEVTGVDSASAMLEVATKKTKGSGIRYYQGNILEKLPFDDNSFELVFASYVAHGLKKRERKKMYEEMSRLSSKLVILHDYNNERALLTDIVEWLEGGDYFNFIKIIDKELKENFKDVKIVDIPGRAAWYVCSIDKKGSIDHE